MLARLARLANLLKKEKFRNYFLMKKQVARVARVICMLKNSILRPLRRDLLKTPNESRKSRDAPVCGKIAHRGDVVRDSLKVESRQT